MYAFSLNLYVDWNNNGSFVDANELLGSDVLSVSTSRGRSSVNDEYSVGSLSAVLKNLTGKYSPYNSSSPLYGNLLPGRPMKLEVVVGATTYPIWRGTLGNFGQSRSSEPGSYVDLDGLDDFDQFRLGSVRVNYVETKRTDELLTLTLDAAGWPAGRRTLDTGQITVPKYWSYRDAPVEALRKAVKQEMGGFHFLGKDGNYVFRNRYYRQTQASALTVTNGRMLGFQVRREDVVDSVVFTRAGLDVEVALTDVYTLSPTGRQLNPGSTDPLNTIHGQYSVAAKNVVTPIATTDFVANDAIDGSGANKTSQVTVSSFTNYGGGFTIVFNVLDSSPVYLTMFKIRANAVRRSNDERKIEVAAASPIVTGQVYSDEFEFLDDASAIKNYATWNAAVRSQFQPRPRLQVIAKTSAEFESLLALEIGNRITVTNTTGLYPTQINGEFFIEGISWNMDTGKPPQVDLTLFHEDLVAGNFFRISGAAGGGQDYSTIAPATGSGYDRLAY